MTAQPGTAYAAAQQRHQLQVNSLANQLGQKGTELAIAMAELHALATELQEVTEERNQLANRVQELEQAAAPAPTAEEPAAAPEGKAKPA